MASGLALSVVIGLGAGLGAVAFRWLIANFHDLFFQGGTKILPFLGNSYVIVIPAAGGLLVGSLTYFFAKEAKGHGVPEVMLAVAEKGGVIRPRVAVIKSLASSICIGSGGSAGREGPIVQIGSALGSTLGQILQLPTEQVKVLVACGAAGGISATFNAPIAAVFFSMEIILRRFSTRYFSLVVISSVVADVVARAFLGDKIAFAVPKYQFVSAWELITYSLLGVLSAFVGVAFVYTLYKTEDVFEAVHFPEYLKPVLGGFAIGAIGLFRPEVFGVGYDSIEKALAGQLVFGVLLLLILSKLMATSLTLGTGGSGGVFAPSLFMGSMLGGAFGHVVHGFLPTVTAPEGAYALVGMAAVFAAGAHAPITAVLILFEMTNDYLIILPLMAAVVIATTISQHIDRESIYTTKLVRRGIVLREGDETDVLRTIKVREAMVKNPPTVYSQAPVRELMTKFEDSEEYHAFPVIDESGDLVGIVTESDVAEAMSDDTSSAKVGDIATTSLIVVHPDQSLHEASNLLAKNDIGRLLVVSRDKPQRLLGLLRRHDIIRAYGQAQSRDK
ncbi:MAG: chloride channel protein [Chloroflexi bacterium]|nr:chloride channel protein [Chloroflexota bacterium]